ncbi:MAG TPA: FlgT C-terminal domain-containing protein [Candidatus Eremiobacteraeota bacterium]|nr:FlgT C-terminal domain-containing protein [Candidatus Eremiobacteraeota bacterium]
MTLQAFLEGRGTESKYGVKIENFDIGSSKFNDTIVGIALQSAVRDMTSGVLENTDKIFYTPSTGLTEGVVAYIDKEEVIINIGSEAGVKSGDIFNIIKITDITDPLTGQVIKVKDDIVGEIHIFEVDAKSATGKILNLQAGYSVQVKDPVRKKM